MKHSKFWTALPLGIAGLTFLACAGAPAGNNSGANSPPPSVVGTPGPEPEITLGEFDQIKQGQTYEEVKAIVGVAGEVTSEFASSDPKWASKTYKFNGVNLSSAIVIFTGGVVSSKSQFGLQP